ncbi:uncharacterized protein LOC143144216 isoform X2 [Ptiloglossa arizonensis]|uniref:uncharacterized protein LOC143144216 isoform X2 n=1 Tax=Ptiloglossa arizonensis TaxID=3350558 RepID=UPI003FA16BDC
MDRFLNIDWNPSLEDIINNSFMDQERFEKESVMHKIMTGNFIDPFKNIDVEYKDIKTDLMNDIESEADEQCLDDSIETIKMEKKIQVKQANKIKRYVPGIVKPIFKFPKKSKLNKEQQAKCLRVLLRFSESDKPKITPTEREELQNYMDLQKIISQEQDEFLEFAKSKWHERSFSIICEDYINLCWKSKLQNIHNLPRYYAEVANVPFVASKNIEVKFISDCLQMGQLSKIVLPTFTRPYMLRANSEQLLKRFPPKNYICNESPVCFKLPVSEDPNCQKLAENNNVDLVISSSGLNCLVNNIGPSYSNSWILPLVIKRHNDKNVIYIDKAAPPNANTIPNKNNWIYKYILKYYLVRVKHLISESTEAYSDNIFGDVNCEELLKLEDEYENTLPHIHTESHVNVLAQTENENSEGTLDEENTLKDVKLNCDGSSDTILNSNISNSTTAKVAANKSSAMAMEDNVSYKLFAIGPQSLEQNELMKNVIKEYKMLVRTKTDGFEILQNNVQKLLLLAPKLEHQVDFGAEAVTLEESLKQWISLIFRPLTFLARVRISAETSEILQVEHRTAMSISNEIKRLYNVKVEDSLTILHNVVQSLINLSPGRYIMRHTVRNGSFAVIYKEVESPGKNIFDLHTVYGEQFHSLHNPPWIPLDKIVPNPMLKCFERMPAMFYPINSKTFPKSRKSTAIKKSNTGIVRRSLRNKKKK